MIKIGRWQKLFINNFSSVGAYLHGGTDDDADNILLPNNEIEGMDLSVDDEVEVFIYMDSEDRPIATFREVAGEVGELVKLEVVDINENLGAFLSWGLNKDLLLPIGQQEGDVEVGKKYLVGIYGDSKKRLSATMRIYNFLIPSEDIKKNQFVDGTVYRINEEIGVFVAVEDRYYGLIPKAELFNEYKVGDEITARVLIVREDGKLDLTEREFITDQMTKDAELILKKMKAAREGFKISDKSSPKEIEIYFNISKKAFKRAMGSLLKRRLIEKTPEGYFKVVKK